MNKVCFDMIALSMIPGIGSRKINSLLGGIQDTYRDTSVVDLVKNSGMPAESLLLKIDKVTRSERFQKEIEYMDIRGIKAVCILDETYPFQLRNIFDPPVVLYYKGNMFSDEVNSAAIIGSRKCSLYGMQMAGKLASDLARAGITVISGMARGIDTAAHKAVIKAGGRTIAVMGSGFDNIYPAESASMIDKIIQTGAVVTEYPSYTMPLKYNFPRRNRIISALSKGTIVVEAAEKSGALITAEFALEHGKEVCAVPGRADLNAAKGSNKLLKQGAHLVTDVNDVIEVMGLIPEVENRLSCDCTTLPGGCFSNNTNTDDEINVLGIVKRFDPVHIDDLESISGFNKGFLAELLLKLEIKRVVKKLPGGHYILREEKMAGVS